MHDESPMYRDGSSQIYKGTANGSTIRLIPTGTSRCMMHASWYDAWVQSVRSGIRDPWSSCHPFLFLEFRYGVKRTWRQISGRHSWVTLHDVNCKGRAFMSDVDKFGGSSTMEFEVWCMNSSRFLISFLRHVPVGVRENQDYRQMKPFI